MGWSRGKGDEEDQRGSDGCCRAALTRPPGGLRHTLSAPTWRLVETLQRHKVENRIKGKKVEGVCWKKEKKINIFLELALHVFGGKKYPFKTLWQCVKCKDEALC